MSASSPADQVPSVLGELHYLDPASTVLRRFTAPGASANTGRYEPHVVPIRARDEVLFFVFNDSDHSRAWPVMHTAFRDPSVETSVPRHSIEARSFAFFQ